MQILIQTICTKGRSLREAIASDARIVFRKAGPTGEILIQILETRLDALVLRAGSLPVPLKVAGSRLRVKRMFHSFLFLVLTS